VIWIHCTSETAEVNSYIASHKFWILKTSKVDLAVLLQSFLPQLVCL
jgi:hypothetical protein